MRAPALSLPLFAASLLALPTGTAATDRHCRQCQCTLTFGGTYDYNQLDAFMMARVAPQLTGGGGYWWNGKPQHLVPHGHDVAGTATFRRLCGTGAGVAEKTYSYDYFKGGKTTVTIKCDQCGTHVACKGGSDCPRSGLVG